MTERSRVEIPIEIAAQVLFKSDRRCCVCREKRKPVQLHHIDGNPANSIETNLAVLCLECHRETQIRGGFDRKLDAAQVALYKSDWVSIVAKMRNAHSGDLKIGFEAAGSTRAVKYLQMTETSEENSYSFGAEYPHIDTGDVAADGETNLCISAFITNILQNFRAEAIAGKEEKDEMRKSGSMPSFLVWDDLSVSHIILLYTPELLSIRFDLSSYYAMAVHPNLNTRTLNFQLHPSLQLRLGDIFRPESDHLCLLSEYCIKDIYRQQPSRWSDPVKRSKQLQNNGDGWVLSGAGHDGRNFERFVLVAGGIQVYFDPYQVGSYGEGRYEVFLPKCDMELILRDSIAALL